MQSMQDADKHRSLKIEIAGYDHQVAGTMHDSTIPGLDGSVKAGYRIH